MKNKTITLGPLSPRARSIFKNKLNSNGLCKITKEEDTIIFLRSVTNNVNLIYNKSGDLNWEIVTDEKVAQ